LCPLLALTVSFRFTHPETLATICVHIFDLVVGAGVKGRPWFNLKLIKVNGIYVKVCMYVHIYPMVLWALLMKCWGSWVCRGPSCVGNRVLWAVLESPLLCSTCFWMVRKRGEPGRGSLENKKGKRERVLNSEIKLTYFWVSMSPWQRDLPPPPQTTIRRS
jgi:hypothetical protein